MAGWGRGSSATASRRRAPVAAATVVGLTLVAVACTSSTPDPVVSRGARPVDKRVCAEASPESGLEALDRELVPYGPDVLGIESTWGDGSNRLTIYSGGYFDDIFEAYDDLEPVGAAEVRGEEATVYEASFLGDPVWAATWREDGDIPCDAHAVISIGMDEAAFRRHLGSVR